MWFDNIGHELKADDYVLCLTGDYAYTVQRISKLSQRSETTFIRYTVTLECKVTVSAYNVISLSALGITSDDIHSECVGQRGFDTLGNPIQVGDSVLFLHRMEMYTQIGRVTKLAPKTCIFDVEQNRFNQTTYKKPYSEIISLTALGLDNTIINTENRR